MVLLACSDTSSPKDVTKQRINDELDDIAASFSIGDLPKIMEHYHMDFHHDGYGLITAEIGWAANLAEYSNLRIENLKVDKYSDDYADVSFNMIFEDNKGNEYMVKVPENEDEMRYFYYNGSVWFIYGNQE